LNRFGLDEIQAQAIVQMRLGQLTGLERIKVEDEMAQLKAKIADFIDILSNESRILTIVREETGAIAEKFGDDRRTVIENVSGEVDIEDLIPEETCVFTMTNLGYIKRIPADAYNAPTPRRQRRQGHDKARGGRGKDHVHLLHPRLRHVLHHPRQDLPSQGL